MIKIEKDVFVLETNNLSYIFHRNDEGLLLHDYFGSHVDLVDFDVTALKQKHSVVAGTAVMYKEIEKPYSMDQMLLEFSFPNKGDFKTTPVLLRNDKYGYTFEFAYDHHEVNSDIKELEGMPTPHDGDEELVIYLKENTANIIIELHYIVFADSDVIARNIVIQNNDHVDLHILKALSFQLDFVNDQYQLINFTGGWAQEMNEQVQELKAGLYVHESRSGNSSSKTNPLFILKNRNAGLNCGDVYTFNLIYSGNHINEIELSPYGIVRVQAGINPFCFDWPLKQNERFETPFAVMTYSPNGFNGARKNMHHLVNNHVVPKQWNNRLRPVVINNWEATYFRFNEKKLLKVAKQGKKIGAELFVLDDGWFGERNDDHGGLGDYNVNEKKLPHGLDGLAKRVNKLGMKFGLWFEPESVNPHSDLYVEHKDWAISNFGHDASLGRNQLLLDLTKPEVRQYIIDNVSNVLENANIEYVKWDMNRNMSDIPQLKAGQFYHSYILGLYEIMKTLTKKFPDILFEGCASGGNRFDLGILSYFPQIWASDDTDGHQRMIIQSGYYYGYPPSCISNHVSAIPSHQMLRKVPLETRFNVAMFGVLGYELLPKEMEKKDLLRLKTLIEIYKQNREVLQFGELNVLQDQSYQLTEWQMTNSEKTTAIFGHFNVLQEINNQDDFLKANGLKDDFVYEISTVEREVDLSMFGGLINAILPVHVNPNGKLAKFIFKHVHMKADTDNYTVYGSVLNNKGVLLNPQWKASGFNNEVRIYGDFGSRMYIATAKQNETH